MTNNCTMSEKRKMTNPDINVCLGKYLRENMKDLTISTRKFTPDDVIAVISANINGQYSGKDEYRFLATVEAELPMNDGETLTQQFNIQGYVTIEEDENGGPCLSDAKNIFLLT